MSKEDGGPAFPVPTDDSQFYGLSVRDFFAAAALTGMLSIPQNESTNETIVEASYEIADLMLQERAK